MDAPQTHIWGPHLWIILHSAAEWIGTKTLKKLPQEEVRIWRGLLSSLRYSLPCPVCKKHYTAYLQTTAPTTISQEFIRSWLYKLHSDVNARTDKPNTITIEQLNEIYSKPFNFTHHFNAIIEQMTRALRLGWCSREDIHRTSRFLNELKQFYDFF